MRIDSHQRCWEPRDGGSDSPVCQRRASYDAWCEAADALTAHLDEAAREAVFGGTAARFYRLGGARARTGA